MPVWLMKVADRTYREWSTILDDWVSEPMGRVQALDVAVARACADNEHLTPEQALQAGVDTMRFVDRHLCSCRARLGETYEIRNGLTIARGIGPLAYHFDSYERVAQYCRTQEQRRQ